MHASKAKRSNLIIKIILKNFKESQGLVCLNGGVLANSPANGIPQICICNKNYIGDTCEKRVDSLTEIQKRSYGCALRPCWIGATCEDTQNGFVCHCAAVI